VIPAPVQLNVAPLVVELALMVPLDAAHVNVKDPPAVTAGVVVLLVTPTVVVDVHAVAGFVTVTVYVPTAFTVAVAVVPPLVIPAPVQLNVAPLVVELALIVPLDAEHVNVNAPPAVTAGTVVLLVTPTVVVDVHAVPGSVTVTVYVPTAFTVAVALEPPLTIPGPDQEYVAVPVVELALIVPVNGEQPNTNGAPAVAVGGVGTVFTTAFADAVEVHVPLSTVNVYVVPAVKPVMVVLVPVPVVVTAPGFVVTVQVPVDGKPVNTTLAVVAVQVGCVNVPNKGAVGAPAKVLIVIDVEAAEEHVPSLTVKVYVEPPAKPVNVVVVPVPVVVVPPGVAVIVHVPLDGNPLIATSPVATVQLGCVIVPITGTAGVVGCTLITTFVEEVELHVPSFTINV
jgi:hypothetical protein